MATTLNCLCDISTWCLGPLEPHQLTNTILPSDLDYWEGFSPEGQEPAQLMGTLQGPGSVQAWVGKQRLAGSPNQMKTRPP